MLFMSHIIMQMKLQNKLIILETINKGVQTILQILQTVMQIWTQFKVRHTALNILQCTFVNCQYKNVTAKKTTRNTLLMLRI